MTILLAAPWAAAQQAMNNSSVIQLIKAGLSDDLVITTINSSAGNYDTSTNGLIALKGAGISDKVISAIMRKNTAATQPAPAAAASSSLPAGIDEVGVYYMDKDGKWNPLMPEVVNFKTGGVLKSFASGGVIKGDVNGHLQGPKAKLQLVTPVALAVYAPEGVSISEYQLLHLRSNTDSREFRSVTGGIMHVSGGAMRDLIEFQPEKIAPRVFQIKLQANAGRGEFGLLPPGAVGSSNMGSSGKIYSFGITE
jgi:hypothetical protein